MFGDGNHGILPRISQFNLGVSFYETSVFAGNRVVMADENATQIVQSN
jgi:hypothetical protein